MAGSKQTSVHGTHSLSVRLALACVPKTQSTSLRNHDVMPNVAHIPSYWYNENVLAGLAEIHWC